jgi:hypothetical protein
MFGCSASLEPSAAEQYLAGHHEFVIGGFRAESAALDAVGTVSFIAVGQSSATQPSVPLFRPNCTGTLIDEDTVVTAKHCIRNFAAMNPEQQKMVFTIGSNSAEPKQWAEVVAVEAAPGDRGGFVGMGHDVGVLHLDKRITAVAPFQLASTSDELLGQGFVSIGYGWRDNTMKGGERLVGAGVLNARTGLAYEALFGSFEAYFESEYGPMPEDCEATAPPVITPVPAVPGQPRPPTVAPSSACLTIASARARYDSTLLETNDELVVGVAEQGAQPCHGDSGGPLVRAAADGSLVSYGVVSGGEQSRSQVCDYGTVYASFPPDILQFLQAATAWVDPCADVPAVAMCEGDRVQRCSTPAEGERRLVSFDCQSLGLRCVTDTADKASCGEVE